MTSRKMTQFIIGAMILGIIVGHFVYVWGGADGLAQSYSRNISLLTDIFLRLIKMIIAPLVFTTLVVGMARIGDGGTIGRITAKTFGWFVMMSVISLILGLITVQILQPGEGLNLPLPPKMPVMDSKSRAVG
ncbi:cation:dicarboxylate symporter family transporter [Orrella marina]|uniref:cation:dicarboxylate symporter family transporter n=1 Tax=Orrella marina TaxID=2163011 RepID=UPI0026A85E81|nr:cation:dicarboxylase symporter family transporter [Orrella marina]